MKRGEGKGFMRGWGGGGGAAVAQKKKKKGLHPFLCNFLFVVFCFFHLIFTPRIGA